MPLMETEEPQKQLASAADNDSLPLVDNEVNVLQDMKIAVPFIDLTEFDDDFRRSGGC